MLDRILDAQRMKAGAVDTAMASPVRIDDRLRSVGPVVLLGHALPGTVEPGTLAPDHDVRAHPHIGLAAISYLLEGHVTHRDSLGFRREAGPGDLNCMIAGRGAVHSERFDRLRTLGGTFEMFQILLALPDGHETCEPSFRHVGAAQLPRREGVRSIAPAIDFPAPLLLDDVVLEPGGRHQVAGGERERAIYVVRGEVEVDGQRVGPQQTALLAAGAAAIAATTAAQVIVFGGEPVGPRFMWWNYIDSSLDRIEAAKADWRAGRVPLPPGDTEAFTPAPPDDGRPLHRLNVR